ncbi:hypothetical protein VTN00DRAFT_6108 [Thermoascus crustaceus]|uniref:uncharacterized protein n=1 Tax=Thermoascus crustaceus TaxID=5088 RepID=UPI0037443619
MNLSTDIYSIWFIFVFILIHRLSPHTPSDGLQQIIETWSKPANFTDGTYPWPKDFSRDILPKPCHSHNDYSRKVPLYDALAAGCTGVEADIWLGKDANGTSDLLVGHTRRSLTPERTLRTGVSDMDPNATLTLLTDFKTPNPDLYPMVHDQLSPLRSRGWLSHWNGTTKTVVPRPRTVVATGDAPFDRIVEIPPYRDIFFDAPLNELPTNKAYTPENSYYASISLRKAIGFMWSGRMSEKQKETVQTLIQAAAERGLVSRFWSTPGWPVSVRNWVWSFLVESRIGMLNVDDLVEASQWDWSWCTVAGLVLFGY